jgi:hypothetical protein
MSDLKTFWTNPGMPSSSDLSGDTVTSSAATAGRGLGRRGARPLLAEPAGPGGRGNESPNSVSGLPSLPNRFERRASRPSRRRSRTGAGTIDERRPP